MEREQCHSLMDKSTDNKHFKSAVNTSLKVAHMAGHQCISGWNEIKYIQSSNKCFCVCQLYMFMWLSDACECVPLRLCVCHHSRRCLMSADRCLICAALSLKQTFHQHNGTFQPLVHIETPADKMHKPKNVCK